MLFSGQLKHLAYYEDYYSFQAVYPVRAFSNVISDSVLFAVKSFNIWLENTKHSEAAEEEETYCEIDVTTEEVAQYVGFKVMKQGNKLVRLKVPKAPAMKLERESFDPLIKRLPGGSLEWNRNIKPRAHYEHGVSFFEMVFHLMDQCKMPV